MRHLQTYRLFESAQTLTQDQQKFLDKYTKGGSWSLNPSTGLVDVDGDFYCSNCGLNDLQGILFGAVTGSFYCGYNKLTSLAGAPETVGGDFYCDSNKLTSLAGAPETVGGKFYCSSNKITSLAGAPQTVGGKFYCNHNNLTSLAGAPETVGGKFSCDSNNLTSLAGAPETVGGGFSCDSNKLTSLAGAPETVGGGFYCYYNNLTSLAGAPQAVGRDFDSDDLKISKGKWGLETFIYLMKTGTSKQKQLVAPLVDPKVLQQQIDENPEGMLVKLKGYLKHPHFQGLKWPERLEQEKGLLSDLGDVGL